jgi:hypothetical protein
LPTPVERTLKALRDEGLPYWRTEHYNPYSRKRVDLFNLFDYIAIGDGIIGIQVTSASHRADHRRKILEGEYTRPWLEAGGRIQLRTWRV